MKIKIAECKDCTDGKEKPLTAGRCCFHYKKHRAEVNAFKAEKRAEMNAFLGNPETKKKTKPIPKVSEKRKAESREYTIKRLQFLAQPENQKCPVTGEQATEIHHKAGRCGALFLDTRYWLAVSRNGHIKIENSPEWAKEMGYSVSRLEKTQHENI